MRFESNGATRRLRQSKQRSAPGIPIFKGCASLSRTGRRSCGSSRRATPPAARRRAVKKPPVSRRLIGRQACLLGNAICALAGFVLRGLDREAHFLGEVSADEAPDAVVLPVGGPGDLGHRRALGAAQEVQDDVLFRELARHFGLLHFGGLLAGDLLLGLLLRRGLGLLGGFLRALVGLGRALLLAGSLLRGGLLRRDLRALF